jgi:hypothetical protein
MGTRIMGYVFFSTPKGGFESDANVSRFGLPGRSLV